MADIRLSPPYMYSLGAIWPPVCGAVVGLRFYVRRAQRTNIGVDDWLALTVLVSTIQAMFDQFTQLHSSVNGVFAPLFSQVYAAFDPRV